MYEAISTSACVQISGRAMHIEFMGKFQILKSFQGLKYYGNIRKSKWRIDREGGERTEEEKVTQYN